MSKRIDSINDAQTLINIHKQCKGLSDCWESMSEHEPCCELQDARAWGDVVKLVLAMDNLESMAEYATEAAHAAFKAIPGLRG